MTKLVTLSAAIEKQLCITLKKSRNFVKKTTVKLQKLIIALDLMNYKDYLEESLNAKKNNCFYS